MAEVVLYHHVQGRTAGVIELADTLRGAGHTVHTPDLFDGLTFGSLEKGIAHASDVGFDVLLERGVAAAEGLGPELVYMGISLGVMPAQRLAQTRAGARGAVFLGSCIPVSEFGSGWPEQVPVQIHGMDADPIFVGEGDIDAARELVASTDQAELFTYSGKTHLFVDSALPDYDEPAATLATTRMVDFLQNV